MEKINIPLIILCLLSIRSMIFGAGIGDALAIIALTCIHVYQLYINQQKVIDINQETKNELTQLQTQFKELKDNVTALKISKTYTRLG